MSHACQDLCRLLLCKNWLPELKCLPWAGKLQPECNSKEKKSYDCVEIGSCSLAEPGGKFIQFICEGKMYVITYFKINNKAAFSYV